MGRELWPTEARLIRERRARETERAAHHEEVTLARAIQRAVPQCGWAEALSNAARILRERKPL